MLVQILNVLFKTHPNVLFKTHPNCLQFNMSQYMYMWVNHLCVIFLYILLLKPIFHGQIFLQEMTRGAHIPSLVFNTNRLSLLSEAKLGIEKMEQNESGKCFLGNGMRFRLERRFREKLTFYRTLQIIASSFVFRLGRRNRASLAVGTASHWSQGVCACTPGGRSVRIFRLFQVQLCIDVA